MNIMEKVLPMGKSKKSDGKKVSQDVKKDLKRYRRQFENNWKNEEKAYFGDIWHNTDDYRPYENHIFQLIEGEVPILSDSLPGVTVETDDEAFSDQAEILGKAIEWVDEDQCFEIKYPSVVRKSLITGTGFIHEYFDANADDGEGKIIDEILGWEDVYLSGESEFIETCAKARIELRRSKSWLKLNYSKYADQIEKMEGKGDFDAKNTRGKETVDVGDGRNTRHVPQRYSDSETLKLVKTYKKDYSLVKISEDQTAEELQEEAVALSEGMSPDVSKWQDHEAHNAAHAAELAQLYGQLGLAPDAGIEGAMQTAELLAQENPEADFQSALSMIRILELHMEAHGALKEENPKGEHPKYPGGYRVIHTINDELTVYDGNNPDDHGEIPLVPFYCYRDGTIYGTSEIRNVLDSQKMHATMMFKEYRGLQRIANPSIIIDKESGLTEDDVTNEDGGVYVLPQGTNWRHVDPGNISPQVSNFKNDRLRVMQDISGINEATEGKIPHPQASGVTVERVQQQAIGRIRLKDRQNQLYSMKRLGKLRAHNILQYWTTEKVLYLHNEGDDTQQVIFNPMEMRDLKWKVKATPGSMAGIDKQAVTGLMAQFVTSGQLTFDEFLQVADIPKADKIREMLSQRSEQEQAMQELQGQAQQLQVQNIKLKAQINPELLDQEERKMLEEILREEEIQALTGSQ